MNPIKKRWLTLFVFSVVITFGPNFLSPQEFWSQNILVTSLRIISLFVAFYSFLFFCFRENTEASENLTIACRWGFALALSSVLLNLAPLFPSIVDIKIVTFVPILGTALILPAFFYLFSAIYHELTGRIPAAVAVKTQPAVHLLSPFRLADIFLVVSGVFYLLARNFAIAYFPARSLESLIPSFLIGVFIYFVFIKWPVRSSAGALLLFGAFVFVFRGAAIGTLTSCGIDIGSSDSCLSFGSYFSVFIGVLIAATVIAIETLQRLTEYRNRRAKS